MKDALDNLLADERRLHEIIKTLNRLDIRRYDIKDLVDEQLRIIKNLRRDRNLGHELAVRLPDWFGSRT